MGCDHQVGQRHAVGGSQGLSDALARRLESYGGQWRTDAAVVRVTRDRRRVTGVELESGEHIPTSYVVTAIDPQTALLELLDPPLSGIRGAELRATHRSNAVQMLVLLATTALPAYSHGRPGDWNGLQSYVDTLDSLADGFAQAEARRLPDDPMPTYAFTPSALDDSLAPWVQGVHATPLVGGVEGSGLWVGGLLVLWCLRVGWGRLCLPAFPG